MSCRLCKSPSIVPFLDLGFTALADSFLRKEQLQEPETTYPLIVALCEICGLAQLTHVVSPDVLYRRDYPYESSTTATGQKHWQEFAKNISERFPAANCVVDIGSNVGTLLSKFQDLGFRTLGVEPAGNIALLAERGGIRTVNEFFGMDAAIKVLNHFGHPVDIVTATNVFAHVDDLDSFVNYVRQILMPTGVFIFEAPHFGNLVQELQYDTIYHEHLSYLSLTPLMTFFDRHGMQVFDVQERDIHGGSFRVFVGTEEHHREPTPAVEAMLNREKEQGLCELSVLRSFADRVHQLRFRLANLLFELKAKGHTIAAVSAPAKGMTLVNSCGIGGLLDFATEKSSLKLKRYTPGAHILVVPDEELLRYQPDYALLLAWNFADEIMNNLSEYRARGGKFIIPIPEPRIVE